VGIAIGTHLGPYHVLGHIGTGGMGEVYRAEDTRLGRNVALKVLPPRIFDRKEWVARFEREARIVSSLNHPYILTIHEIAQTQLPGEFDPTLYIVTELVEGITLRDALAGDRDLRRMLEYMAQVADALKKAHGAGIVHRDLKPENIMFTTDGYAKVLDFGLAKPYSSGTPNIQTQQGIAMGTVGYMSPEQIQGKEIDHRADVFSFGCVLFEVITGHRAFSGEDLVPMLHRITNGKAPALPANIDPALRQIVRRCLAKDPASRFQNMGDVGDALRAVAARIDPAMQARAARPQARVAVSSGRTRVVAVMPFANTSGDSELEYLSDGITESIIYALSRVRKRLRVVARNTVFAYKNKPIEPQKLAAELGVTAIVTGRVQRVGANIVVAADLVRTADGSQLWGERFQRPFSDILEVEEQIAATISDQLKLRLTVSERRKLVRRPTTRSDAYELYLKGRFHLNRRTFESLGIATRLFEQAVAVDPGYALAWAGLAEVHALWRSRTPENGDDVAARAEETARKAIDLDHTLAEPHATLAFIALHHRWDWEESERQYRAAIALNPDCAIAHSWYSHLLIRLGRADESLLEARLAAEIEPLSIALNLSLAGILYVTGRSAEAEIVCRKLIEIEPHVYFNYWFLGRILLVSGREEEAVAVLERAIADYGRQAELLGTLGFAYGRTGAREKALAILQELDPRDAFRRAEVCVGLGDLDMALRYTEQIFLTRGDLGFVLVPPEFAPLREHPGYREMLQRVGFP
jgi:eukaryotic-like serine/threonine-protein kinase